MECEKCGEGKLNLSNPAPIGHICCDSCDFMDEWNEKYDSIRDTYPDWIDG